jgi:RNA polymerase sigma factor (sigma-70 family)
VAQILESPLRVEDPQSLVAGLVATHGNQLRRFLLARVRNIDDVVELTQILNPPAPSDSDPALETDALQCLEQLQGALEELAPKIRATFLLHRRDGLSLDEIGTRLGISRGMVKKYLMKALLHFRQRLERAQ